MVRAPTTISVGKDGGRAPTTISVPPLRGTVQGGSGVRKQRTRKHKTRKTRKPSNKQHKRSGRKTNVKKLIQKILRG